MKCAARSMRVCSDDSADESSRCDAPIASPIGPSQRPSPSASHPGIARAPWLQTSRSRKFAEPGTPASTVRACACQQPLEIPHLGAFPVREPIRCRPDPRAPRAPSPRRLRPIVSGPCLQTLSRESLERARSSAAAERADPALRRAPPDPRSDEPAGVRHARARGDCGCAIRDRTVGDGRSHRPDARSAAAVRRCDGGGHAVGARAELPRRTASSCSICRAAHRASCTSSGRSSG